MKKLFILLIAISVIALSSFTLFSGCDNNNPPTPAGWDDI